MFTDFDELMAIGRVQLLFEERGVHVSELGVRRRVEQISKHLECEKAEAYEILENRLLDNNPRPEKW